MGYLHYLNPLFLGSFKTQPHICISPNSTFLDLSPLSFLELKSYYMNFLRHVYFGQHKVLVMHQC